jgi:prephenate dehydrogenase
MIGVIGFGRFGQLTVRYLAEDFRVHVYDRRGRSDLIRSVNGQPASLRHAAQQKIVILSVPISSLQETLQTISPMVVPDAVIVDVCSVKEKPVEWMKQALPPRVSILPTHPMFGPDSAANSLAEKKIFLCPERIASDTFRRIKSYMEKKGLIIIETTAREHDRQIAVSLALTHFIGRALSEFGATDLAIDTEGYRRLLHILEVVEHDTWQLFADMHHYNRFAPDCRQQFMQALEAIDAKLHK